MAQNGVEADRRPQEEPRAEHRKHGEDDPPTHVWGEGSPVPSLERDPSDTLGCASTQLLGIAGFSMWARCARWGVERAIIFVPELLIALS